MRSALVIVACLFLAGTAMAQTRADAECLDLGELSGQSLGVLWTSSFSAFLDTYHGELSADQRGLVQQAVDFGSSLNNKSSIHTLHTMKGLVADVRKALTTGQFSEILARMGPDMQQFMADIDVIGPGDIACSCTIGASSGCPEGFPCTSGCVTWGTGRWNGVCTRQASVDNN